jgi:hypothetical protein
MTRLLLFIAAYFASSLAVDHAQYGAGDMKLSAGSKSYGQAAEGSGDTQGLNINANYGEQKSQAGHGYAGVQEPSLEAGENKINGHAGKGDDFQAGSDVQELNTHEAAKDEPTKGIKVIAKGQGGEGLMEHLGEPAMPPGKTHQVRSRYSAGLCHRCLSNEFQVTVGGSAGLAFIPDSLVAEPGDMVQFHFLSKNHTVTQSGFAKPCVKLADGADSGFMPNPDETLNPPPTYKFQVMDKSAICKPSECR